MKLTANPMPTARAHAEFKVNERFNTMAAQQAHRDAAHRAKRETAQLVRDGLVLADSHPFAQEARLRGLPVSELANDVLAKPDNVSDREIKRQTIMLKIAAANTPADLDAIIAAGI